MSGNPKRYARLLSKDNNFAHEDAVDVAFTYDFGDPRLAELDEKWHLREIASSGDTQSRALNLLRWLCAHIRHGNPQSLPDSLRMHAQSLLDWSFDRPGNDPNGKHLSIILSECLLAVGVKAYVLWSFPKVYKGEKQAVVHAWLPEESRWILLDPSFGLYCTGEAGRILSAPELRGRLASSAPLRLRPEGQGADWYIASMAKNMYYFQRARDTKFAMLEESPQMALLCPAGYAPAQKDATDIYATWDSFWK